MRDETETLQEQMQEEIESEERATNANNNEPTVGHKNALPDTKLARSLERKFARDDEPYDFEKCTVLVMLQLMPLRDGQPPNTRKVFITARTHSYAPYAMQMRWDELAPRLPKEINALIERLQIELAQREAEKRAREQAEQQRQAELKAESEKRRAAKKQKPSSQSKHTKKIDLNAPPALAENPKTLSQENENPIVTKDVEIQELASSAQMTMF
ncbi:MAG: hypothetical protein B6D41_01030 [Chloroflexi bacterium UTCFX4]|jgi:hypothetical protein|nr:MAG: hypothetical protein B6D41_01030 [Chloroflexi bacterium UTCFX4]